MAQKEFKSLHIDIEKCIYQLNGENIGEDTSELCLEFKDGKWSLAVTRDVSYVPATTI